MSLFNLTKQIRLFSATWNGDALQKLSNAEDLVQDDDSVSQDRWGVPWSPVPDEAWDPRLGTSDDYKTIGKYDVAYLRFTASVRNGHPGDAVLFFFNQPNTTVNSGLHAQVHVEVVGELLTSKPPQLLGGQRRRSTSVEQSLIGGYDVAAYETPALALARMKAITEVRLVGLLKKSGVAVEIRCDFLGGFTR